jgi:hypothetical protein
MHPDHGQQSQQNPSDIPSILLQNDQLWSSSFEQGQRLKHMADPRLDKIDKMASHD